MYGNNPFSYNFPFMGSGMSGGMNQDYGPTNPWEDPWQQFQRQQGHQSGGSFDPGALMNWNTGGSPTTTQTTPQQPYQPSWMDFLSMFGGGYPGGGYSNTGNGSPMNGNPAMRGGYRGEVVDSPPLGGGIDNPTGNPFARTSGPNVQRPQQGPAPIDYSQYANQSPWEVQSNWGMGNVGMPQGWDWNAYNQATNNQWPGHNPDGSAYGYTFDQQAQARGAAGVPGWSNTQSKGLFGGR